MKFRLLILATVASAQLCYAGPALTSRSSYSHFTYLMGFAGDQVTDSGTDTQTSLLPNSTDGYNTSASASG